MISNEIKGAVVGFIVRLNKGLVNDRRWDWTVEKVDEDWKGYEEAFLDPSILRTTMSVFMNTLNDDASNYKDASFRAFQYFRWMFGVYEPDPPFTQVEMEEPDWYTWG